jgi:hypothetical protein
MSDEPDFGPVDAQERAYYMRQIALARRRIWERKLLRKRVHRWVSWIMVIWAPLSLIVWFVLTWQMRAKYAALH